MASSHFRVLSFFFASSHGRSLLPRYVWNGTGVAWLKSERCIGISCDVRLPSRSCPDQILPKLCLVSP